MNSFHFAFLCIETQNYVLLYRCHFYASSIFVSYKLHISVSPPMPDSSLHLVVQVPHLKTPKALNISQTLDWILRVHCSGNPRREEANVKNLELCPQPTCFPKHQGLPNSQCIWPSVPNSDLQIPSWIPSTKLTVAENGCRICCYYLTLAWIIHIMQS